MVTINQFGIIKGGEAEKRIGRRRSRSSGGFMALDDAVKQGCFAHKNGWYVMVKAFKSFRKPGEYYGGDREIGYLRLMGDIFPMLLKQKKKFRWKTLKMWVEAYESAEFGIAGKTPFPPYTTWMKPPKGTDDIVYEKMYGVKSGLLKRMKKEESISEIEGKPEKENE